MMRANTTVIGDGGGGCIDGWSGLEVSPVTGGVEGTTSI